MQTTSCSSQEERDKVSKIADHAEKKPKGLKRIKSFFKYIEKEIEHEEVRLKMNKEGEIHVR